MNFIYSLSATIIQRGEFDKAVKQVLKKPVYRHLDKNYVDITERIRNIITDWLNKWMEKIFNASQNMESYSFGLSNGIVIIGTIILIILIIMLIMSMRKIIYKNKNVKKIYGEKINNTTTAEGLREKSREFKEGGDYREAVRLEFISLLVKMNEKNLLYIDEAMTNSEMIQVLKAKGFKQIGLFQKLTHLFNEVWFGHKNIHEKEYDLWERNMEELWNGVLCIENKK